MEPLISLLIFVLIMGLIYWAVGLLPLAAPFRTAVLIIFVIIFVIFLLGFLPGGHRIL